MNETTITLTGHLTDTPELRFTASGAAVANFTVASTPRRFDKTTGGWVDGDPLFLRCAAWRTAAENIAESLTRGARVVVTGILRPNAWETREGEKRTSLELSVTDIGASLLFATVKVTRAERANGAGSAADEGELIPF